MTKPIHQRGWDDDHAHLIGEILDEVQPRPMVRQLISYAYDQGYEMVSDGISFPMRWMAQLEFQGFRMKHPCGPMHDALYREGPLNLYVPESCQNETNVRRWMDQQFQDGLCDFGHWFRCHTWYWGLRMFGYAAYSNYRQCEARGDYSHILNKSIIPAGRNAT